MGITLRHPDAEYVPVFCFTAFKKDDFEVVYADEEQVYVRLSLPEEDKLKIIANFGNRAILLPTEFPKLVAATIPDEHYGEIRDIEYIDYSSGVLHQEQLDDLNEGRLRLAFWKDDFFNYQREARLAFSTMPTDRAISYPIGNILRECNVVDINYLFNEAIHRIPISED
jgi:hypothetical protein